MARQYQAGEKLQTCTTRLSPQVLGRIVAYQAHLQAHHPGLRVERSDAVRDLLLKGLRVVEGDGTREAHSGPVEAHGTLGAAQTADLSPTRADQSLPQAALPQAHSRPTGRTGRKRAVSAKG